MTKFQLLKAMLSQIEDYEAATGRDDFEAEAFVLWLNERFFGEQRTAKTAGTFDISEWRISYFVGLMNKYAKIYIKKALKDSPLVNFDDFGFLITLYYEGAKTKTELIQSNISEVSSGLEILKRLERKGLVRAFKDGSDKRAAKVEATAEGRTAIEAAMQKIYPATHLIAGNLDETERLLLLTILNKLHLFHHSIYLNDSKASLTEIKEKYLKE